MRALRRLRAGAALAGLAGLAGLALWGCVPSAPEPTPAPSPAPAVQPTAPILTELPTPTYDDWMDAPQTPGDWRYAADGPATQATFGDGPATRRLTIICDLATRRVGLARTGTADGPVQMRIRTETADRLLEARPEGDGLLTELAASDPLLDALAFSKGRFAMETAGQETLYIPAYPEISRVIEDCRRGRL